MRVAYNFLLLLAVSCFVISCDYHPSPKIKVDFQNTLTSSSESAIDKSHPVYIAIASLTSPKETMNKYSALIDYLSVKLNQTLLIKQKKTYNEVNDLLRRGLVDIAFIGTGAYVELSKNEDAAIIAIPVINGATKNQSYIITNRHEGINNFKDLKDKRFAFTDPQSISGYFYPKKMLKEINTHDRIFFHKTIFTYGHDISIHMVNRNVLDGASVQGFIFDDLASTHMESVKNIKILDKSDYITNPPVVAPKQLDEITFKKYQNAFVEMNEDSLGAQILKDLQIEKWVVLPDSSYDSARKLKSYVEN